MKIISGFFVILLIFFIVVGTDSYKKQLYAHDHYTPVEAVVTQSKMSCSHLRNGGCYALVEYTYSIAGKSYAGTRYAFVSHNEGIEERLQRYPLNAKVTAYADPDHPEMAVLDNSTWSALQMFWLIFPGILFFIGAFLILRRYRVKKRQN